MQRPPIREHHLATFCPFISICFHRVFTNSDRASPLVSYRSASSEDRVVVIVDSHRRVSLVQLCVCHGCTVSLIVSGTGASSAVCVPTQPHSGCVSRPASPVTSTVRAASLSRDWERHGTGKNEVFTIYTWRTDTAFSRFSHHLLALLALPHESFLRSLCRRSCESGTGRATVVLWNERNGRMFASGNGKAHPHLSAAIFPALTFCSPPSAGSRLEHLIRESQRHCEDFFVEKYSPALFL